VTNRVDRVSLAAGVRATRLPRARSVIIARRAARARPRRTSLGQILLVVVLATMVALGAFGGVGLLAIGAAITQLGAGLPDPAQLDSLSFAQPTIIYDRTGKVELARFQQEKRRVLAFDEVPHVVLDTITTAEDRTFWDNDGFDLGAIVAAAVQNATDGATTERGASTITQQLVRARLLPAGVSDGDRYFRKVLEIIQSSRLTADFPGQDGKAKIITAYLNEVYFGHEAYGIAAAAEIYFGVADLAELTPAQAALLAGLVKAPSVYDPYRYAVKGSDGKLVVPPSSPPVVRRNWVLDNLATSRWTTLSPSDLAAAKAEPVVLTGDHPRFMRAPHFSWQVRSQLEQILGSADAVDRGGYSVITTLDWAAQQLAERYITAAAIAPNLKSAQAEQLLDRLKVPAADRGWIAGLRGKDLHNAILIAIDYRHGDVLAYVGSAGYYRTSLASPEFAPEHDAVLASRQPGSAFKPIVYSAAFEEGALTPGSVLLDITTRFDRSWVPRDADERDRGPVLVRDALQQSLNIPAIRALQRVGNEPVASLAERLGINFEGGHTAYLQAGLAGAIGTVETRPFDLTGAFGAIANGGLKVPSRLILSITAPDGRVVYHAPEVAGTQALSPQSAFLTTDILAGNTNPDQNPIWARPLALHNTPNGSRRPAAVKTGTADDARDLSTYGFLAPPKNPDSAGLAVGVWLGNSDHSAPQAAKPATSIVAAAPLWHAFVRDYTKAWPVATFKAPNGVVRTTIDRWSGGRPGPWTQDTRVEWFRQGTQPGTRGAVDEDGLLYSAACGTWQVDPVKAELGLEAWKPDVQDWAYRARQGVGVVGQYDTATAYFLGESSWGGPIVGDCTPGGQGGGGGPGHGHHH